MRKKRPQQLLRWLTDRRIARAQNFLGCIAVARTHRGGLLLQKEYSLVCLSVTLVSPGKAAEPIEMPFGLKTRVGPRKHVLDGEGVHVVSAASTTERSMCGSDAAFQSNYFNPRCLQFNTPTSEGTFLSPRAGPELHTIHNGCPLHLTRQVAQLSQRDRARP